MTLAPVCKQAIQGVTLVLALAAFMPGVWAKPAATPAKDSATNAPPDEADELVRMVHAHLLAEQPTRVLSQYAKKVTDEATKANPNLTEKQKAQLAALPVQIGELVQKNLKWSALLDAYAKIYRKVYTAAEIKAQLSFYRSKEGAAILQKQVPLTNQLMAQTSVALKPVYTALQKLIDDQIKAILTPVSSAASAASS